MDYPPYFTPNGDGYHDTWNIYGIESQLNAKLYIFDRYGKLLKQLGPTGDGWTRRQHRIKHQTHKHRRGRQQLVVV